MMKDIIHLYLGQKCQTEEKKIGTFSSFDICQSNYSMTLITVRYSDGTDDWDLFNDNQSCDRIKLILKPLSDLTEDDMINIWILIGGAPHLFDKESLIQWILDGEVPEGLLLSGREIAVIMQYLLAKGFDLFDLIEMGLAIDKNKLG